VSDASASGSAPSAREVEALVGALVGATVRVGQNRAS
jgi:hypothetical protein